MESPQELKTKTPDELESQFLNMLDKEPVPVTQMLAILRTMAERSEIDRCETLAVLMEEALIQKGQRELLLQLLECRYAWRENDATFRAECREALAAVFKDRRGRAMIESIGLDNEVPVRECLRRLGVLLALQPGRLCIDRTWGFGVVKDMDDFYRRVTIDFNKKPGHQMSLAYAAETLQLIDEEHLLSQKFRDPDRIAALVKKDPAEVVKLALRSYGPLTPTQLKELLTEEIVPETEWKVFWENARKRLRVDPRVALPVGRTEPIRLLERDMAHDDAWFLEFATEKDPERILARFREVTKAVDIDSLPENSRRSLEEQMAYALWASGREHPTLTARLALAAQEVGLTQFGTENLAIASGVDSRSRNIPGSLDDIYAWFLSEGLLEKTLTGLSGRDLERFLEALTRHDPVRTAGALLELLANLPANVIGGVVACLQRLGRERECAVRLATAAGSGSASGELLYWLAANPETVEAWPEFDLPELVLNVAAAVDQIFAQASRRTLRQLCGLFEDRKWLARVLAIMESSQREQLLRRVYNASGWPEASKRTTLAAIVRMYPELTETLTALEQGGKTVSREVRMTSWRSYRARQEQLRQLVEKTIPENSREIEHARSYGDLSENFEYQAAKDRQRLLLQRKNELERDLTTVRGTDFTHATFDVAGMGTCVVVARPDGRQERFCILGEWDRDEALGIIANRSKLAEALEGHKVGDEVLLPGAEGDGTEPCRIVAVGPLPQEVREWIMQTPPLSVKVTSAAGDD